MKILIVEDEPKTGAYMKRGLAEAGFTVDLAADGLDGLHLGLADVYDLIVLDVMLPGLDGWQVLQTLRKAGRQTPVLFLTARDSVDDRVKGLELGADDYLVKPSGVIGCTDKYEYLPNAFSPNGDAVNNVLLVKSEVLTEMTLVIYNRWGQEVFSTNDQSIGWDGTFKGEKMAPDAYAYYLRGTCINGDKFIKKGNVSLLK